MKILQYGESGLVGADGDRCEGHFKKSSKEICAHSVILDDLILGPEDTVMSEHHKVVIARNLVSVLRGHQQCIQ